MKMIANAVRAIRNRFTILVAITASIASGALLIVQTLPNLNEVFLGILASLAGAAIAFFMAETLRLARPKRSIFVSYAHHDADFVESLIDSLSDLNVRFLVDRLELKVGDDIKGAVDDLIDSADSMIFVVSKASAESNWAQKELEQALSRKKRLLPVVLDREAIPEALSGLYYADFSQSQRVGLEQLERSLEK